MPNPIFNPNSDNPFNDDSFRSFLGNQWWLGYDWYADHPSDITHPGLQQFSEWSQQMIATQYQNWWNSESGRMARMQAAGINPYAAAQGIAGVGGSQGSVASSPNSAVGQGAQTLGALGNTAANLLSASGSSFGAAAHGISQLMKLRHEIANIDSDTQKKFIDMGFTENQSRALGIQLKYMDYKERMSCFQALANYENTKAEFDILKQEYENKIEECRKIIAETNLAVSEAEKVDAEKRKITLEADWIKTMNDFFNDHGYILGSPIFESMRDSMVNGKPFDTNAFGTLVSQYTSDVSFASENARARASWNFRPTNAYEAAIGGAATLGKWLRDGITSKELQDVWKNDVDARAEFEEAYSDAHNELYQTYKYYRDLYREYKNKGSDMYVAQLKRQMDDAKKEYDEFTRSKFSDILVSKCGTPANSPSE